jgi:glyoxylase-like metal-dependent hydrolase (beta-lactamase superfamily II)
MKGVNRMGAGRELQTFGIRVIDTGYLRKNFAASHMIVENGKAAFVDVGTTSSEANILKVLHEEGLTEEDVLYIILTHIHLDHAGGAGRLMAVFPNARLVVHPKGARHMIDPEKLVAGSIAVYGEENFRKLYGSISGVPEGRVIVADEGFVLDFEGRKLHFMDTPGHARHHNCIWDPKSDGVFTGDALGLAYPELQIAGKQPFLLCTTSPAAFEPDAMVESIERVMSLQPKRLYLTHFGPVDVDAGAVNSLTRLVREHKELGVKYGNDFSRLRGAIGELITQAYTEYLGSVAVEIDLIDFLKDDIELNCQGIAVWISKQKKG